LAGELERELQAGLDVSPSRITWAEFRRRYADEKLAGMPESSQVAYRVALDHVDRVLDPDKLAKLTAQAMSTFVAKLRREKMKPTTIARHLRMIKAALRWGERQGYMAKAPVIEMPKTTAKMKGRPIAGEEFDRMMAAVPKVRKNDPEPWKRLIKGLWLSGLRIGEAVALDWGDGPFQFDTTGKHPAFRIEASGQKSGKAEYAPMTPDFAEWVLSTTPESERAGRVFRLPDHRNGRQIGHQEAGRVVAAIGRRAGVVVDAETGKRASAHDLRRSFGSRWASRVMPAVLQRLMRHANIQTTMTFYVGLAADDVAAALWQNHPASEGVSGQGGNKSGNIDPVTEAWN
jgi:integrase